MTLKNAADVEVETETELVVEILSKPHCGQDGGGAHTSSYHCKCALAEYQVCLCLCQVTPLRIKKRGNPQTKQDVEAREIPQLGTDGR